jgi:hypothetical protein
MRNPLEPHPFAALFPELPREELTELAQAEEDQKALYQKGQKHLALTSEEFSR